MPHELSAPTIEELRECRNEDRNHIFKVKSGDVAATAKRVNCFSALKELSKWTHFESLLEMTRQNAKNCSYFINSEHFLSRIDEILSDEYTHASILDSLYMNWATTGFVVTCVI